MRLNNLWLAVAATSMGAAALYGQAAQGQDQSKPPAESGTVIKTETRLVVVDAVVTDKKDNYVKDLNKKDFKVYEDGKEQSITTFSFEADPASPRNGQKHYLTLFFDNSTMNLTDQQRARQAAEKFIDKNAGPNRLMAVVNYGGSLQIAQNYTDDADRLREVVRGTKLPLQSANPGNGGARLPGLAGYGARNMVYALQTLAKAMEEVPGRKILVLLTAGMPLNSDVRYSIEAAVAACNKANVAVYPIDVRGLFSDTPGFGTGTGMGGRGGRGGRNPGAELRGPSRVHSALLAMAAAFQPAIQPAAFSNSFVAPEQAGRGGGGTTGGGATGGSTGGGSTGGGAPAGGGGGGAGRVGSGGAPSGGTTGGGNVGRTGSAPGGGMPGGGNRGGAPNGGGGGGNPINNNVRNPNNPYGARMGAPTIVPPFPPFAGADQQAIYMLADGTGGFVIVNNNDLLAGLEKIGNEQDQFYIIGYTPAESAEGSCHTLKVSAKSFKIRSRSGYCNVRSTDALAGKPSEKQLETRLESAQPGTLVSPVPQVTFFYNGPDTARVDLSMEIPTDKIKFEKVKGKLKSEVNVLGLAYKPDGTVGARFSDTVKLEVEDKKELEKFAEKPLHYENQFDAASGEYRFKIAYSANGGAEFGKMELPLKIEPFTGKDFQVSSILLSSNLHRLGAEDLGVQADLVDGRTPFIVQAGPITYQLNPSADTIYKKSDNVACYVEVYEPETDTDKLKIGVQMVIRDKDGAQKLDSGMVEVTNYLRKGNPTAPVALKVPVDQLQPGSYRMELTAADTFGKKATRVTSLTVE